jgi:hypothetical protein
MNVVVRKDKKTCYKNNFFCQRLRNEDRVNKMMMRTGVGTPAAAQNKRTMCYVCEFGFSSLY